MPYIGHARRVDIVEDRSAPVTVGELTYVIQQELCAYLENKTLCPSEGKPLSYAMLGECLAALEGAKADFIHRVLLPYEKRKRKENGEAWGTSLLAEVKHG